ncbi:MAG: dehydrogenase E1 component subunit alpha/beta [Bacteroidota bacterium]|nr:dehydrogenase E1 component subunit alpha/beta [Bacteroidota bacterium]
MAKVSTNTINDDVHIDYKRKGLTDEELRLLYLGMLKPRLIEEKMLLMLRKGQVSKWFSGIGQEAISVGATMAMQDDEWIMPLHRNLGVFTTRGCDLKTLFAQLQGKAEGYSQGRERSFHFGVKDHYIAGMISHLGPQLSLAAGVALSYKLNKEAKISIAFTGEGGTSEGEFHEALNTAAVWKLPVIFIIENNGYGLSTTTSEQYACENLVDRAMGYGMRGVKIDGNNLLEVYHTISTLANEMRENPEPVLIECITFRMRGHEEASGTKYVPQELFDLWAKKDPLTNYENWLKKNKVIDTDFIYKYRNKYQEDINEAINFALDLPAPVPNTEHELAQVYAPYTPILLASAVANDNNYAIEPQYATKSKKRLIDALSDGLKQSMQKYPELILMGQDIAEYGGVFKITENFVEEFGLERVRNTTLCESAIVGIGLGLSLEGKKAMIEMQFADFVTCAFNQIVNNLAKMYWRWGQNADVVIRMPTGAGVGAGPFHSQSNEAWFFHVPGLKIVYPSTPADAKGLLCSAIEDPNPILVFEHKALYRSVSEEVYDDYYTIQIGKAKIVTVGDSLTVVTYGAGVHWVLEYIAEHPDAGIELIDLRTLLPWDTETVTASVQKTGKVLVLNEDSLTGSISAEIAAYIGEYCFTCLDAPVKRIGSLDTPIPFAPELEQNYLPKHRLIAAVEELLNW